MREASLAYCVPASSCFIHYIIYFPILLIMMERLCTEGACFFKLKVARALQKIPSRNQWNIVLWLIRSNGFTQSISWNINYTFRTANTWELPGISICYKMCFFSSSFLSSFYDFIFPFTLEDCYIPSTKSHFSGTQCS